MKTSILVCALAAANLFFGLTFKASAQPGGGKDRGAILSSEDRNAAQEATRDQLTSTIENGSENGLLVNFDCLLCYALILAGTFLIEIARS